MAGRDFKLPAGGEQHPGRRFRPLAGSHSEGLPPGCPTTKPGIRAPMKMALVAGNGLPPRAFSAMTRTPPPSKVWMVGYPVMNVLPFGRDGRTYCTVVLLVTAHAKVSQLFVTIVRAGTGRMSQGGGYGAHQVAAVDPPPEQGDIG